MTRGGRRASGTRTRKLVVLLVEDVVDLREALGDTRPQDLRAHQSDPDSRADRHVGRLAGGRSHGAQLRRPHAMRSGGARRARPGGAPNEHGPRATVRPMGSGPARRPRHCGEPKKSGRQNRTSTVYPVRGTSDGAERRPDVTSKQSGTSKPGRDVGRTACLGGHQGRRGRRDGLQESLEAARTASRASDEGFETVRTGQPPPRRRVFLRIAQIQGRG